MRAGYALCTWLARTAFRLVCGVRVEGLDHIPRTGRVIIASNHRSNLDPPLVGSFIPREVHFLAKAELFDSFLLGRLVAYLNAFPIRRGEFDRRALDQCRRVLRADQVLVFFPEGTRAPANGFLKPKIGLGWVAGLVDTPIVPAYVHGSSQVRLRLSGRPGLFVLFGQPVRVSELNTGERRGRELYQAISDAVLERIRELSLSTPGGIVTEKGPLFDRTIIDAERLR